MTAFRLANQSIHLIYVRDKWSRGTAYYKPLNNLQQTTPTILIWHKALLIKLILFTFIIVNFNQKKNRYVNKYKKIVFLIKKLYKKLTKLK